MERDPELITDLLEVYEDYDPFEEPTSQESDFKQPGEVDENWGPPGIEELAPRHRLVEDAGRTHTDDDYSDYPARKVQYHVGILSEGGYIARDSGVFSFLADELAPSGFTPPDRGTYVLTMKGHDLLEELRE